MRAPLYRVVGGKIVRVYNARVVGGKAVGAQIQRVVTTGNSASLAAPSAVVASSVTSSGFTLSWSGSAAAVSYDVQIDGVSYATPTATTAAVAGRAASTAYSVRVRARDASGNYSALSTAIMVTTGAAQTTMAIGVNVHPLWTDYSVTTLDRMQAAGVQHVRADFGWSDIQPTGPTQFNGSRIPAIDAFMTACGSRGIKVLAMLYKPPFWSSGAGTASNPSKAGIPANAADFGVVLAWFIDRYKANLSAVEMFNEMDIATFSSSRSAIDYVRIMKGGYAGAAGRGVPLIAGAATYLGLATGWLTAAYAAGLATGTGDFLAVHPYMSPSNVAPTGNTSGSSRQWSIVGIADVKALQAANGDTKPLWATEFGWSSHANTGGEANYQIGVTEQQQADYIVGAYQLFASLGVKGAYVYSDRNTTETLVQEANFGLMNYDFTPKPAYTALAAMIAGTGGSGGGTTPPPFTGKTNSFAGITSGSALTTANSGGTAGDALTGVSGSLTVQTASGLTATSGDVGVRAAVTASASAYGYWTHPDYSAGGWAKIRIRRDATLPASVRPLRFLAGNATSLGEVRWTTAGLVQLAAGDGTVLADVAGATDPNVTYRIEVNPVAKTLLVYVGSSTTPINAQNTYTGTFGAGIWDTTRFGIFFTAAQTFALDFDDIAVGATNPGA